MTVLRRKHWNLAFLDLFTRRTLDGSGGVAFICAAGTPDLVTLYNVSSDAALANPVTLTRGAVSFGTLETVETVDIYVLTPTGHFAVFTGMNAQEFNELCIDTQRRDNVAIVPFSVGHTGFSAATEFDTGLDFPIGAMMLSQPAIKVTTEDATETIDVGFVTTDPNGLIAAADVATAGFVAGSLASGAQTIGALISVDEGGGVLVPQSYICAAAQSLSWTLTAGSNTAKGFIILPYRLLGTSTLMA
jgi:hypothetical protein